MPNIFLSGYLLGNVYKVIDIDYEYKDYMGCSSYKELKQQVKGEYNIAIGYSLGGRILLRLLAENHITVNKLYLISSPFFIHKTSTFPYGMEVKTFKFLRRIIYSLPEQFINVLLKTLYYIKLLPSTNWSLKNIKYWFHFLKYPFSIENIKVNATIIHGNKDWIVNLENAKFIADKLDGKLITLNNTGHIINPFRLKSLLKE
ncbi:hypothetical protein [Rickettsiales endosymbiont of Stachyamoeba lipophora]|uniref:hypothetical protein n=1 Tax=Rickettsiales endosymbiont of Stachyamoeba lipophora TaxID=2486578 RepID=UPI000F64DCCB|nr:hypothetical protein [Rickettsiales endosymbiont of Stachyamoeba lipophora]AZL16161.1 hypothetical protein EF513_06410 [Rickettsiales endosymbiont of Stachyamoeba lipophora]